MSPVTRCTTCTTLFRLAFLIITSCGTLASAIPFRNTNAKPATKASSLVFTDLVEIIPANVDKVRENLIHSSEEIVNSEVYEAYPSDQKSDDGVSGIDFAQTPKWMPSRKETFVQASRNNNGYQQFYRSGHRTPTPSDSIIFPSESKDRSPNQYIRKRKPSSEDFQNQKNDFYSYRPGPASNEAKPTTANSEPVNFYEDKAQAKHSMSPSNLESFIQSFLKPLPSQDQDRSVQVLAFIIRNLALKTAKPQVASGGDRIQVSVFNHDEDHLSSSSAETTTSIAPEDEVDFQSLYSGQRVNQSCPPGQQKTSGGSCQGGSRNLQNSRG